MKTQGLLILIYLLICITSCKKDTTINLNNGITFSRIDNKLETIVNYVEIIGYDSTQYVFRVNESAWKRLENEILPGYPDPHFGFGVVLNNDLIYRVAYIQPYYSMIYDEVITFSLKQPDMICMELGYPASPNHFRGEDLRNNLKLINLLKKDNKLIEIKK